MHDTCLPTPEAIAHLNLEVFVTPAGKCLSARSRDKTTLDDLVDKTYIEPYHADYGLTFSILRDVWLGKLNGHIAMLSDAIQPLCPQNSPSEVYDHVRARLKPVQQQMILWAIHTYQPLPKTAVGSSQLFYDIFDQLAEAFTNTHKVLAETKQSC